MKYKEWLKDKIEDGEYNLKYVYDNCVPYENVLIADDVYDLIDQLDEPEITEEQAWNEEIARLSDYLLRNFEKEIGGDRNYETPVDAAIRLLGEKRKPVIPQFVTDWIETMKQQDFTLGQVAEHLYSGDIKWSSLSKYERWARLNFTKFARAWMDGYEVEEEKEYYVVLPAKGKDMYLNYDVQENVNFDDYKGTRFTEAEIKSIDKRYWAFAEEVTE